MYAQNHFEVLELLESENGLMWDETTSSGQDVLEYLDSEGLCTPRSDIQDGLYLLTEKGKAELEKRRQISQQRAEKAAKDVENEVKRVKERKQDRRDKWLIALISACSGYVIRLCVENLEIALVFFRELFQG